MKKDVFLGHSVKDGRLRFTSVSAIKLYDTRKEGCKRKWAYKYLFGIKILKTKAQTDGIEYAAKLEHYLTTGEDVLPPVLQQAKRYFPTPGKDLECEQPLGDMEKALAARDAAFKAPAGSETQRLLFEEAKRFAGLHLNGVPLNGAADVRHTRGEYIDKSGIVCKESSDTRVVNIADLKVVSQIFPHRITKGEKKGQIRMPFTLTDAEIANDVQMLGYGRHAVDKYPDMTHARLSLIYTNSTKKEADLRMAFVSKQQILDRWHGDIEPIVVDMEKTCGAVKPEDIEPNLNACDAFTHIDPTDPEKKRVLKGCPHRYYCSRPAEQVGATIFGNHKERAMSLFDSHEQPITIINSTPSSAPVPADPAAYAAQVEAEKAKLRALAPPTSPVAAVAVPPPPVASYGFCSACGSKLDGNNASKLPNGSVKHIGCTAQPVAAPPPPPSPIAVNPPDQPRAQTMLQAAAPVPADAIAEIKNPQLRAEVEEHARQHAEKARLEAEAAAQQKAALSVWCNTSSNKIIITADIAVAGKWVCHCGKSYSVKALKPVKNADGNMETVIPRHKPPKKEGEEAVSMAAPPMESKGITIAVVDSDEEETNDDATVVMASPPPPPAPPPLPAPTTASVVNTVGDVVGMIKPSTNGHTNGHGHAEYVAPSCEGRLAFVIKLADGLRFVVVAAGLMDAINKVQNSGSTIIAVELIEGKVIT
jgi:hypothetical protein